MIEKGGTESIKPSDMNESRDPLEEFKTVARNLTDDALKVLNKIVADEMGKPKREQRLLDDYYLLFNYLHLLKRLVSSKNREHESF